MRKVLLLGASGSIGTQALDVFRNHRDKLKLVGCSVGENKDVLKDILKEFELEYVYCIENDYELERQYPKTKFYFGNEGLLKIVKEESYDLLVNALVGFLGFRPTLIAIQNHKDIALANKETLVAGGDIIMPLVKEYGINLYPIDSEHSAILQSLQGHNKDDVRRLIITASGGAFRDKTREELNDVTLQDALKHPVWSMGSKITIDSATMMNKAFEVMEAHYLFDIDYDNIDVLIHKQSIVHSLVEYNDGSLIAQLGTPDMHLAIKYALLYPNHIEDKNSRYLDFDEVTSLDFKKIDYRRFPLVKLVKDAAKFGGSFGAVLIGANDEAVRLFLHNRIKFVEIEKYVLSALKNAKFIKNPTVDEIIYANEWAKDFVATSWANS